MNQAPVIAGIEITTDQAGRFNLNALHRASGGAKKDSPGYWISLDNTRALMEELAKQTTGIPVESIEGRNGGTFAHELLAISYAGWISPRFQLQVNQVFLDYRKGKLQPAAEPLNADPRLDDIAHSLRLGLIDQAEATRRTREILDSKTTRSNSVTKADISAAAARLIAAPAPQLARPSGASVMNLHDDAMYPGELAHWVMGGEDELWRALRAGGFVTKTRRPTTKGLPLFRDYRGGRPVRMYARKTLQAIGAWPGAR